MCTMTVPIPKDMNSILSLLLPRINLLHIEKITAGLKLCKGSEAKQVSDLQ